MICSIWNCWKPICLHNRDPSLPAEGEKCERQNRETGRRGRGTRWPNAPVPLSAPPFLLPAASPVLPSPPAQRDQTGLLCPEHPVTSDSHTFIRIHQQLSHCNRSCRSCLCHGNHYLATNVSPLPTHTTTQSGPSSPSPRPRFVAVSLVVGTGDPVRGGGTRAMPDLCSR